MLSPKPLVKHRSLPPAGQNLFEKRFRHLQKLFIKIVLGALSLIVQLYTTFHSPFTFLSNFSYSKQNKLGWGILPLLFIFLFTGLFVHGAETFQVLCYHDVRDDVLDNYDPDSGAVSTTRLISHFAWLKDHGYHVVSIDDLINAGSGQKALPEKAVLITFDDGLKSIYTRVYPLLKVFNYPVVVGLVGAWLEGDDNLLVKYGPRDLRKKDFLTWEQIKELNQSGLVEFASHSYNLHVGVLANPQGNMQPAPSARIYDPGSRTYEDDNAYKKRITADLRQNIELIKKHLGQEPRVMVWPYGKYNRTSAEIATSLGMTINLTLEPKINRIDQLGLVGRHLISHNPHLDDFIWLLRHPFVDTDPFRMVQVDLDYLYDKNPKQQARNLDVLLERIKQMRIGVVFLQAFADEDGDGAASALYFPNRHLPVKADLFNRTAWQLKTRSEVKVYAWMPVMAFKMPAGKTLTPVSGDKNNPYHRLSAFDPQVKRTILEIYEDLGKHADFDGILFHDDAILSDFEDASPQALTYYRDHWGLPANIKKIHSQPEMLHRWTKLKTSYLIDFTHQLKHRLEKYRAPLKTVRNIYAHVVMKPESSQWFAQSYREFLKNYDYTAIMAMPYLEKAKNPMKWLSQLVEQAQKASPDLTQTIFELQSKDWNTNKNIPAGQLVRQMELLQLQGALNIGYYPDDFIGNQPALKEIRKGISLQTYPYNKK